MSALHGLILVDKPQGLTSHDVVARVRKSLMTRDVGHCGTLDPMATGLMLLAVGEGLKLVSVLTDGDKAYEGEVRFGVSTDTLDITGQVLHTGGAPSSRDQILQVADTLCGELELQVPKYSAVKVQGERLHEKAREGQDFTPPNRLMTFYNFVPGDFNGETWRFAFSCSKGSFVRSWVAALCERLKVPGTLSALRRTYSFPYSVAQAITLEALDEEIEALTISGLKQAPYFIALDQALPDWGTLRVYRYDLHLLRNGQISKSLKAQLIRLYKPGAFTGYKVFAENSKDLVALIGLELGKGFFIKRGFRPTLSNQ